MLLRTLVLLTAACLTLSSPASAARLFGTTGAGSTLATLVELDPVTGALINTIGSVGYTVNGLEYDATTGTLFGTTGLNDPNFLGLIEIDILTGAGTPIGAGFSTNLVVLTSNSVGQLFGWDDPSNDDLAPIDKVTGADGPIIGDSGIGTAQHGLAFDAADTLWLVNSGGFVYTVNAGTGLATATGGFLGTTAHHGDFDPMTGLYYGIDVTGDGGPRNLIVANLSTATVLDTLATVDGLHTLTFVSDVSAVPEPTSLLIFGGGLLALAFLGRRKRG